MPLIQFIIALVIFALNIFGLLGPMTRLRLGL